MYGETVKLRKTCVLHP